MGHRNILSMGTTTIIIFAAGSALGYFGWMVTSLSYEYYLGQALDIYVNVFVFWAAVVTAAGTAAGVGVNHLLSVRRNWNSFLSMLVSAVGGIVLLIVLDIVGLFVSRSVAVWFGT
jgi:hypothetical protein